MDNPEQAMVPVPAPAPAAAAVVVAPKPKPPVLPSNVREMLSTAGITSVAVIDDVFDPPSIAELGQGEVDGFAQNLADQDAYHTQANALGLKAAGGQLNDAELDILWKHCLTKGQEPLAQFASTTLFRERITRHTVVTTLCGILSAIEALKVAHAGAEDKLPDNDVQLVFLDYVLQPHNHGGTAVAKIKEIYGAAPKPPLIILISDFPNVDPIKRLSICHEVGTLGGYFGFIAKQDLGDETMLCLKMAELGIGLANSGHKEIREFAGALADAISASAERLRNFVRGLELQDYVHLESKRLDSAGEPLGEYVEWLIESMLGHMLGDNDEVKAKRAVVDALTYTQLIPVFGPPSNNLTKAFFLAQTEPRISENSPLHLGDVFLHSSGSRARLVISPACDLMRDPPPERPVFYVEGQVDDAHTHTPRVEPDATECFLFEDKPLRITWDVEETVRCVAFAKFRDEMQTAEFKRAGRLRPIFAVAIQRLFSDRLCRVGLPIAPPVGTKAKVRLFVNIPGGNYALIGDVLETAGEVAKEDKRFEGRLSTEGVAQIRKLLRAHLEQPDLHKEEAYGPAFETHKGWIAGILSSHQLWLRLVSGFVPFSEGKPLPNPEPDVVLGLYPGEAKKPIKGPFTICISRD